MPPKSKATPPAGQRSIMSFFGKKAAAAAEPEARPKRPAEVATAAPADPSSGTPAIKRARVTATAIGGKRAKCASASPQKQPNPKPPAAGVRVRVWWVDEEQWYAGEVQGVDGARYLVSYDDGDELWHEAGTDKYELALGAPPSQNKAKPRAKRAAAAADGMGWGSEEEEDSEPESDSDATEDESDWDDKAEANQASDDDDVSMDAEDDEDEEYEEEEVTPRPKKKAAVAKRPASKKAPPMTAGKATAPALSPLAALRSPAPTPARLSGEFSLSPSAAAATAVASTGQLLEGDAMRFAGRYDHKDFVFLREPRDAKGVRRGETGYDPTTLRVPASFLSSATPSMRQWWDFKRGCFDAVVLFKMGKFYEMFEMDALIGHADLGLIFMAKSEKPHCGFPEKNYAKHAETLARKGHRVMVIEQVETPDQLKARNSAKPRGQPKEKVVRREKCALLSAGTIVDQEMLEATPDAAYLLVLTEGEAAEGSDELLFGACAVDAASAVVRAAQWRDDKSASALRALLAELRPAEVLQAHKGTAGALGDAATRALRQCCRPAPRLGHLEPGEQLWEAARTLDELKKGGCVGEEMPPLVAALRDAGGDGALGLRALGGAVWYLRQALLDREVLSAALFAPLAINAEGGAAGQDARPSGGAARGAAPEGAIDAAAAELVAPAMEVDGSALANLEILANTRDGGVEGTLLALMDRCVTAPGRRTLRRWLCRPLACPRAISRRQDAVAALKQGGALGEKALEAREQLRRLPDLERCVGRLAAQASGQGRSGSTVVLYEDAARAKLKALLSALRGFRTLAGLPALFEAAYGASAEAAAAGAHLPLRQLGAVAPLIGELERAFDWDEAEAAGRVAPAPGADEEYDAACEGVEAMEQQLEEELGSARVLLGAGGEVRWIAQQKETHQLEVPERLLKKVPAEWELSSERKGFRRFLTPLIREMRTELQRAEERKEAALGSALTRICERAAAGIAVLRPAADAAARLDALLSLAAASELMAVGGEACRPVVRSEDPAEGPVLRAARLRHPAAGDDFVPNDVSLGGAGRPRGVLLTGPNMGGKSTLMRTVCLAAVLAQVGCDVPAASCELTPADRVFVRMGAEDSLAGGESTFMVELAEASAVLRRATRSSLVALDELGRGTGTGDGAAIAGAVLQWLAETKDCRLFFSTHYHTLSTSFEASSAIALAHMSAAIEQGPDGAEQVTFLYTLAEGACPRSYGVNVARLAGLPAEVLASAAAAGADFEAKRGSEGPGAGVAAARRAARATMAAGAGAGAVRAAWADAKKALAP